MYVQHLANTLSEPSSIKNYMSGAKIWVLEHFGNIASFTAYEIGMMVKAVIKKSNHIPRRALALSLSQIYRICDFLDKAPSAPKAQNPCVLIGYACYLRASNLLCDSVSSWGGPHTLKVLDIVVATNGVQVTLNSTKSSTVPTTLWVHKNPVTKYCPKQAWITYIQAVKPISFGPGFVLDSGHALTPNLLVDFSRAALTSDPDVDISLITSHSLCRGATQNAASENISIPVIMKRGGWRSKSGLAPYLIK